MGDTEWTDGPFGCHGAAGPGDPDGTARGEDAITPSEADDVSCGGADGSGGEGAAANAERDDSKAADDGVCEGPDDAASERADDTLRNDADGTDDGDATPLGSMACARSIARAGI
jgi:hypothetical protein